MNKEIKDEKNKYSSLDKYLHEVVKQKDDEKMALAR